MSLAVCVCSLLFPPLAATSRPKWPFSGLTDFIPLRCAARYLVGKPKAALRYRRQKYVVMISVSVDSDFAGDPVSRKSTTGLVAQIANHTVKSGLTLQSLTALSVGEVEFYAVVKGGQVGLSLRSMYQDLGTPMKIEIQSDSSTANSLTDRLGAGQRTKHIDTRYFWIKERVQDGDLSIKKVLTAKNCADVGTMPVSASAQQQHCKFLQDWYSTDHGSHTPLHDEGDEPMMDLVTGLQPI